MHAVAIEDEWQPEGAKLHVADLQKAHRRFIKVAPEQPRLFLGTDGTQLIDTLF